MYSITIDDIPKEMQIEIFKKIVQENDIYFKGTRNARKFCDCKGWGCNFCCEDLSDILERQGGGF